LTPAAKGATCSPVNRGFNLRLLSGALLLSGVAVGF